MKFLKYILVISYMVFSGEERVLACGPYYPENVASIRMFRCCSPELERQWQEGCRFQDYEKEENCVLWQKITSPSIPLKDIENVIYSCSLSDLVKIPNGNLATNKFAQWLSRPENNEDLEYVLVAKEIEEIREYMNDPWYYSYDGDAEHIRLKELQNICEGYVGKRHAARYALQQIRLNFAVGNFKSCIDLWESDIAGLPKDIVTDMIASYVGGAYVRSGERNKALELFTRSQDIGSLISMNAWNYCEEKSEYSDSRIQELEYIFNRFPDSPLLRVKLQEYVRDREVSVLNDADNAIDNIYWDGDSFVSYDKNAFYDELKRFAENAIKSNACEQKGLWHYALGFLEYLDGNVKEADGHLRKAERRQNTQFLSESIRAFRFLLDSSMAKGHSIDRKKLLTELKWLDECMSRDVKLFADNNWQDDNWRNVNFYYWQDVARRVLLSEVCPKILEIGDSRLALQLANYASNRIHQLAPLCKALHYGWKDGEDPEMYSVKMSFDEYRTKWTDLNSYDYSNQFFEMINGVSADQAAKYGESIANPSTESDRFLNERSYIDPDYIYDIIGTLYVREMNYEKAVEWYSKVSKEYQIRTNIAKEGFFKLDPFSVQSGKDYFIKNSEDYRLRFAQEMLLLESLINSECEVNRKANAKIRYAIGLRNSFGRCWYLTGYGYNVGYDTDDYTYEIYSSIAVR